MTKRTLQLAVFDLDYTVWRPEMYQLHGKPRLVDIYANGKAVTNEREVRTKVAGKMLVDGSRTPIRVFHGASYALADINRLREAGRDIRAGVASKTDEPQWARYCMDYLVVDEIGTTLSSCFKNLVEIHYGDKQVHLKQLQKKTGIPFENMAFFDNEHWNIKQVSKLGVKCYYTPDGMTQKDWDDAKRYFGLHDEDDNSTSDC